MDGITLNVREIVAVNIINVKSVIWNLINGELFGEFAHGVIRLGAVKARDASYISHKFYD